MTEWRKLGPQGDGRDPESVLDVVQRAVLAEKRVRERSHEIAARCRALADQARKDLKAARACVEAAEARAEAAERRARTAETQAEELERWLNRIEGLLTEELTVPEPLPVPDPLGGPDLLGRTDSLGRLAPLGGPDRLKGAADAIEVDGGVPASGNGRPRPDPFGWDRPAVGEAPADTSAETGPGVVKSAFASLKLRLSGLGS